MVHAGTGTMRQHVAGPRLRWSEQQGGDARGIVDHHYNRLCIIGH
jgi:hypothetical protein